MAALSSVKEIQTKLEPLDAAPRAEPEHRRSARLAERPGRARHAQSQGAREPAAGRRARRRPGQPRQRDGLGDGRADRQAQRRPEADGEAEETIGRIEKLRPKHRVSMDTATKLNAGCPARDRRSSRKSPRLLLEAVRTEVGALAIRKREFESFDERVHVLQSSVADTEARVENVAAKDKNLTPLLAESRCAHACASKTLFAQADELTQKQMSLDSLHERFAQLDELSKKAVVADRDAASRAARTSTSCATDVQEFYKSHAEIAMLRDKLGCRSPRRSKSFGERMARHGGTRAGARRQDGRDSRQDDAGRRRHAEGDPARRGRSPSSTRRSRASPPASRSSRSSSRGSTA